MRALAEAKVEKIDVQRPLQRVVATALVLWLAVGCGARPAGQTAVPSRSLPSTATPASLPTPAPTASRDDRPTDGLSDEQIKTLSSLEQVDDYPLYTMYYHGVYSRGAYSAAGVRWLTCPRPPDPRAVSWTPAWACSLFAALGDSDGMLYGRNFDWEYSPALLLFTDPPDGYASVSMVDIAYLGFGGSAAGTLLELPLLERRALLDAPFLPFDGMNEHGLVVGMAAVPPGHVPLDPEKETIGSLGVIRSVLDHASNIDEAVSILQSYNIDWTGGPPLHYLIASPSGDAVLVEFYQGDVALIPNETPWHLATNFLRSSAGEPAEGECWRYDRISQRLREAEGRLSAQEAVELLSEVSQGITQWSIVYGMSTRDVTVAMGKAYDNPHAFRLSAAGEP